MLPALNREAPVAQRDQANGDYIWVVQFDEGTLRPLASIVGAFLHNLRTALDHLVWELSSDAERGRCEFPVFLKSGPGNDGFHGGGLRKIASIPDAAKSIIEELQPFHAEEHAASHPLWLIHDLDRIDKHRRTLIVPVAINRGGIAGAPVRLGGGTGPAMVFQLERMRITTGKRRNGEEVLRIAASNPPESVALVTPLFGFNATIDEAGLEEVFIQEQLRGLLDFVDGSVIPRLEPIFDS